jgi:hypothetical protein
VSWHGPTPVSLPGDRPIYAAPAISPGGDRAYVVYEAVTSPWRGDDVSSPRPYHGVFLSAPVDADGPGTWAPLYDGPFGDLRASYPGHRLREERIGDYVYAAASRDYGVGVWLDARNARGVPGGAGLARPVACGRRAGPARAMAAGRLPGDLRQHRRLVSHHRIAGSDVQGVVAERRTALRGPGRRAPLARPLSTR